MSDKYIIGIRSTITSGAFGDKYKGPRYTGLNMSVEADNKKDALKKAKETDQYKKNVKEYKSRVGKELGTGERMRISSSVMGPAPKKPSGGQNLRNVGGGGGGGRLPSFTSTRKLIP